MSLRPQRWPLLGPALGLACGVATGLAGPAFPAWALILLALAPWRPTAPLAFAAAGWLLASAAHAPPLPAPPPRALEGRIVTAPDRLGDRIRFQLALPGGSAAEVWAVPGDDPVALGDRVLVRARLRTPAGAQNPGGRDAAARLSADGVGWQAAAEGPLVRAGPPGPVAPLERCRTRLAEAAARWLPPREAGLVRAIGAGDRGGLDPDANRSFARSGLAHILAVSGMHLVVVVSGLQRVLLAALLRWRWLAERIEPRRAAALALLPFVLAYALATGAGPPVLRAALAAAAGLLGVLLDREASGLNGLALAALALLALHPGAALDPSFQLSFAAVGGLVLWGTRLRRALPFPPPPPSGWRARLLEPVLEGACATVAASLATAPVLAFHFRQLPLLGLLANVAAIPLGAGLTVCASVAAVAAAAWPPLAAPLLLACWPQAWALRALSDAAGAPQAAVLGIGSPGLAGALLCVGLLVAAGAVRRWPARATLALAAAAALLAPAPLRAAAARARGGLEILFVSVGQGDAALLRLPDGSAVLVDGGGSPTGAADPGERILVPLLRDLGVRELAAVFVSHPHPDHVLGLAAVARAFPVREAFTGGAGLEGDGPQQDEVHRTLAALHPRALAPGDRWERAGVRFEVRGGPSPGAGANDRSLVLRVTYGEASALFPGDIEAAGEAAAVAAGGLGAEVVKVPHHGSRTSSTPAFVAAVGARLAVACVGLDNRFGFPHDGPAARWRAAGAAFLRTDEGAVRLLSDGRAFRHVPADTILDALATWREQP